MAVDFIGLTFGDTGNGWAAPSFSEIRAAISKEMRAQRGIPDLNTDGGFYGALISVASITLHACSSVAASAVNASSFLGATGDLLARSLAPVTIPRPASPSRAFVYAYGATGATVAAASLVQATPVSPAFAFQAVVSIPAPASTSAWVFEIEEDATVSGVTFTWTVDGLPVVVVGAPGETASQVSARIVDALNASVSPHAGTFIGPRPGGGWTGGIVVAASGVIPATFDDGGAGISQSFGAARGTADALEVGPTVAQPVSLRRGQSFAGIEGYVNVMPAALGRFLETSSELRARHQREQRRGAGNPDVISNVLKAAVEEGGAGATYAVCEYNPTPAVVDGNAPHSIRVVVDPAADATLVAEVIWTLRAAGDGMNGAVVTPIVDSEGNAQTILHDVLETVFVWVEVDVLKNKLWPQLGDPTQELRLDLVAWLNGLGGGRNALPNEAPISLRPDGTPRGVDNFDVRLGSSTDPLGIAPPISWQPVYPSVEPVPTLAAVIVSGRQVLQTDAARVAVVVV